VKKKFLKPNQDTPEATANNLAMTNPEVLPSYVSAMAQLLQAQAQYFNRDVVGTPSQTVIDLRAIIRPTTVVASIILLAFSSQGWLNLDEGIRSALVFNISNWMGSRTV
jgi:energy-converting hydrogenase Eha subunit F